MGIKAASPWKQYAYERGQVYNKVIVSSVHITYPSCCDLHLIIQVGKGISEMPFQRRDVGITGGGGEKGALQEGGEGLGFCGLGPRGGSVVHGGRSWFQPPPAKPRLKASFLCAPPAAPPAGPPLGSGRGVSAAPCRIRRQLALQNPGVKSCWSGGVEDGQN